MTPFDESALIQTILADYKLPLNGDHGVAHWARVLETGLRLASESGAHPQVVRLFAILHDCRRVTDLSDPNHGPRAAKFARRYRGELFELPDPEFDLLVLACQGHTHKRTHPHPTVQTCWDADRLDLGRVGITPDRDFLSTSIAKRRETIAWADGRATFGVIPLMVRDEWGIDLPKPG